MTREEAKDIIRKERLRINWYDDKNLKENEVGIKYDNGEWTVFVTDERANVGQYSIVKSDSEEKALEVLISKARLGKKLFG